MCNTSSYKQNKSFAGSSLPAETKALQTDRPTDGPTDRRTDTPSYRDARTHLKMALLHTFNSCVTNGSTDGRTDGPTDRPTDQRTKPVIEIQFIEKKKLCIL